MAEQLELAADAVAETTATGAGDATVPDTVPAQPLGAAAVETPKGADPTAGQSEPAKATEAAPAVVAVKVPEGVDDAELAKAFEEAKGDPQKIADAAFAHQERSVAKARAASESLRGEWQQQIEADKEIGGKWLNEDGTLNASNPNAAAAKRALTKYGTPELVELLGSTSAGSNPHIARLLVRVGKALAEDSVAGTTTTSTGNGKPDYRQWYPNSQMNP